MTISALYFLDSKGKTLLSRNYRGDIPVSAVDQFPILLIAAEQKSTSVPPCLNHEGINYLFTTHNDIYVLALSKHNTNAAATLTFLHQLVQTLTEYVKALEEESIRDNFVIIYELLDEMMDFGHAQITDHKILQEFITQESYALDIQARSSSVMTDTISWRPKGIYYKKNELFLDVIESVEFLLGTDGNVIRHEVQGKINVNAYLSGMPILKLGLNDDGRKRLQAGSEGDLGTESSSATGTVQPKRRSGKSVHLENVKFHQCVELDQFETDRTISFTPPDGNFELMSYRVTEINSRPLFAVNATIDVKSRSRAIINVTARSQYRKRSSASSVEIAIPVPRDADSPRFRTSKGTVVYAPELNAIVWKIRDFPGQHEYTMKAEIQLSSLSGEDDYNDDGSPIVTSGAGVDSSTAFRTNTLNRIKNQPVTVKFEIPYFALSGLQVRYLKVTEPRLKYPSLPWVRYLTQNGSEFSIRLPPANVS
jgi:AP-1 complex subunit mu